MKFISKKVCVKEGTIIEDYDYSGYVGKTLSRADNGVWLVEFNKETLSKLPYEYIEECELSGKAIDICYFEEKDLIFL